MNVINQNGTVYIENKEYSTLNGNPALTALQRIYNAEVYADTITATIPNYKYYRRDHLGNNREVWVANTKKTIQRTQYYPSGLPWASNTGDNPGQQPNKYNGKQFDEMNGYDTYDYGARGYYAAMGRFTSMDPLAEKYYSISPYAYCGGNPVRYIDQNGEYIAIFYVDKNGNNQIFIFDGSNQKEGNKLKNDFVNNFIQAYDYDTNNKGEDNIKGGENLKEASTTKKHTYLLMQTSDVTIREDKDFGKPYYESVVLWNPKLGSETLDGKTRESPATVMEHEFAHDVRIVNDLSGYSKDRKTFDPNFENKEEWRDCTGPETRTARANKELTGNNKIHNHFGRWFITTSPISNKKIKYFRK